MEETLVFIDEGLLKELMEFFGEGARLRFDKFEFAKRIAKKQDLFCKHLFYYTCPPFQSDKPTEDEASRKKGHDKFVNALLKNKSITVREGRCQRLKNDKGEFEYHQKEVDNLLTIDMGHIKDDFPEIKKVVLVSSDTDFCPSIRDVKKRDKIEVILYTYFDRKRKSKFSLSNELIDCCSSCFKLTKEDFTSCPIIKSRKEK
ncbi:MAG: NYN domain-containing protein [Nanoarchaeota archaeon]|nr:NYN domain-containing protein [Nanoarchaeota archaeon]MBU1104114.1 NYN domain-containing protein [Nanoarchaeota archaeon]